MVLLPKSLKIPSQKPPAANAKHPAIVAALRAEIIQGRWTPGMKLPVVLELAHRFRTSKPTILNAVSQLVGQGYLRTEERAGTFVTDHPPHRSHYALAFPFPADDQHYQFYHALHLEAAQRRTPDCRLAIFHDIHEHVDSEDFQQLAGLVQERCLAGLIFAHYPYTGGGALLAELGGVPQVAIMEASPETKLPTVYPAIETFVPKALEYLASHGRRRVALAFHQSGRTLHNLELLPYPEQVKASGLQTRRYWMQSADATSHASLSASIEAVFRLSPADRPDSLIITDDNLVEAATAGLVAAGIRVPTDVTVVAQTNFPYPTPSAVPVTRLGYDIPRLLATCLDLIGQQQRGETPPRHTVIPALFEAELTQTIPMEVLTR